jgi:hypothetical protein
MQKVTNAFNLFSSTGMLWNTLSACRAFSNKKRSSVSLIVACLAGFPILDLRSQPLCRGDHDADQPNFSPDLSACPALSPTLRWMVGIFRAGWKPSRMGLPTRAGGSRLGVFLGDTLWLLSNAFHSGCRRRRVGEDGIFGNIFPANATLGRPGRRRWGPGLRLTDVDRRYLRRLPKM